MVVAAVLELLRRVATAMGLQEAQGATTVEVLLAQRLMALAALVAVPQVVFLVPPISAVAAVAVLPQQRELELLAERPRMEEVVEALVAVSQQEM